jgi:SAM-dependent methyltransferase
MSEKLHQPSELEKQIYEYWQRQPCGIKHSQNPVGTREYFLDLSRRRSIIVDRDNVQSDFVDFASWQGKRVLEIGCGVATDGVRFAQAGADYVGIDLTDSAIELARQRFALFDLSGQFKTANAAEASTYQDLGQFDLVYSWGVIHHWPDLDVLLQRIHDCLKPNGTFIFLVYAKNSWKHAMVEADLAQYEAQDNCPCVNAYYEQEVRDFLHGRFEVIDLQQRGTFMYNLEKYKQGILELEPWFAAMPESVRTAVDRQLGGHYIGKVKKI